MIAILDLLAEASFSMMRFSGLMRQEKTKTGYIDSASLQRTYWACKLALLEEMN